MLNGKKRPVFRINIKFHGSAFQRAKDLVGLEPQDCFALATYKVNFGLEKQQEEHLAYIFVIVGVPGLTGDIVELRVPEDLVHLCAIAFESKAVTGKLAIEDTVVGCLTSRPAEFGFEAEMKAYYEQIRAAPWYALSARRTACPAAASTPWIEPPPARQPVPASPCWS